PYDWTTAIKLVEAGSVQLDKLVTHTFKLDDWEEAFDLAATSHDNLRVAIEI
ncbi:MAG: hypothetical protein GX749_05815, partial [Ruminococcaceae bacterium]|nr:hypothetical protein [Oscillospiraceae bacterium]